jgi:hypothetical protein
MLVKILPLLLLLCCFACGNKSKKPSVTAQEKFDKGKWQIRKDNEYVYRNGMLNDLITNHLVKGIKTDSVFNMLGEPTRTDSGYLFYTILQPHLINLIPLSNKSLVIKLTRDSTVEWRKIHQ